MARRLFLWSGLFQGQTHCSNRVYLSPAVLFLLFIKFIEMKSCKLCWRLYITPKPFYESVGFLPRMSSATECDKANTSLVVEN